MLFARVKIAHFRARAQVVFYWCLYDKSNAFLMYVFTLLTEDLPAVPQVDLVLAISTISSNANSNLAKIKGVVQELIDAYGVQRVYYSVILFGRVPNIRIRFTQQLDEAALKSAIQGLQRPSGGSSLSAALETARGVFRDGRPDSKKVLLLVMDAKSGSSMGDVKETASKLEENGIKVIPLMFGGQADPDETSATTTNKQNVVKANETSDTKAIAEEITQKVTDSE